VCCARRGHCWSRTPSIGSAWRARRPVVALNRVAQWSARPFIAGVRQTRFVVPLVLDSLPARRFAPTSSNFSAPALAPADVVALDNLAAHKVDGVRQALAAGASILGRPPYSPDLSVSSSCSPRSRRSRATARSMDREPLKRAPNSAHEPTNRFFRRAALPSMQTADDRALLSQRGGSNLSFQQLAIGNARLRPV
jgi:hypothetical protein